MRKKRNDVTACEYAVHAQLASRLEPGLQAASSPALFPRPGISQGPWDCPTRKRRERRAPFADRGVSHSAACAQAEAATEFSKALPCARPLRLGTSRAPFAGATATLNKDLGEANGTSGFRHRLMRCLGRRDARP